MSIYQRTVELIRHDFEHIFISVHSEVCIKLYYNLICYLSGKFVKSIHENYIHLLYTDNSANLNISSSDLPSHQALCVYSFALNPARRKARGKYKANLIIL